MELAAYLVLDRRNPADGSYLGTARHYPAASKEERMIPPQDPSHGLPLDPDLADPEQPIRADRKITSEQLARSMRSAHPDAGPAGSLDRAAERYRGRPPEARRRPRPGPQLAMITAIGIGGVVGALSRYALEETFPPAAGHIPWVVFVINVSGSALLGLLLVILVEQFSHGRLARLVIGTGIIGAYTTFSTFMVGAVDLARAGHVAAAALYTVLSVVCGLAAVTGGIAVGRLAMRTERWLQEVA